MAQRKLTLRKDTLTELTTGDLRLVAGASGDVCYLSDGCVNLTESCLPTCGCTGHYPSINARCTD